MDLRAYRRRMPTWNRRLGELYDERGPLINEMFSRGLTSGERRLLRFIERQIDWYEMAIARPRHLEMRALVRRTNRIIRSTVRLLQRCGVSAPELTQAADATSVARSR